MRFRSASKRERSKKYFLPQGIFELWRVASASFRRLTSIVLTPLKERLRTLMVPPSLQAAEHVRTTRTNAAIGRRIAGIREPKHVPAFARYASDDWQASETQKSMERTSQPSADGAKPVRRSARGQNADLLLRDSRLPGGYCEHAAEADGH